MTRKTKRIQAQNALKLLSNYAINTLETTDEKLKAVEHMQEFFEHEFRRILKGDPANDRCQYCGEREGLLQCEHCYVIYCTKQCDTKHDNKGCIKLAFDKIMNQ
jgi:hypothetical protein